MSTLVIPLRSDVDWFDLQVELEKVTYTLELRWNDRDGAWFLSIYTLSGELLAAGRKLVTDFPLTDRFRDPRLPPGQFVVVNTSRKRLDPEKADLGNRVQLLYRESADVTPILT